MISSQRRAAGRAGGLIGGRSKSPVKVAAARVNARLGGRPPKHLVDALENLLFAEGHDAFMAAVANNRRAMRALLSRLALRALQTPQGTKS